MRLSVTAGIVMVAAASCATNAGIISQDWHTAGDGLITLDTSTGYRWLDLTATLSYSFNEMEVQLQAGGAYDGWRRATMFEVDELYTSAGIMFRGGNPADIPAMTNFLAIEGTLWGGFRTGASAFTSEVFGLGHHITSHFLAPNESWGAYALAINNGSAVDSFNFGDMGHWLVQAPTPGSAALLVMGGVVATRRRRR